MFVPDLDAGREFAKWLLVVFNAVVNGYGTKAVHHHSSCRRLDVDVIGQLIEYGKIGFEIPGVNQDAIQPVGVRITKDGKRAFVALGPANRVAVIDTATLKVERYLLVGQRVWQLGFTPDEKLLFTTNGTSNDVSVIDVEKLRVLRSIKVGRYPWGVVVAPF